MSRQGSVLKKHDEKISVSDWKVLGIIDDQTRVGEIKTVKSLHNTYLPYRNGKTLHEKK